MTYAADADLTPLLGNLADRLPSWVDKPKFLEIAHARVVEALGDVYPDDLPAFAGPGLEVVKWAEAKLAAAEILAAIRINLPADAQEVPERYREEALAALRGPVVGYPLDAVEVDDGDPDTPTIKARQSPRVSSFTPMSAFADPYEAARLAPGSEVGW